MSDIRTAGQEDLDWLLQNLINTVPGTRHALLLSSDGLKKAAVGLGDDDADSLAAIASGLSSLGKGVAGRFGGGGEVRQVIVEVSTALLFVCSAGSGAVLAVLAGTETHADTLGYEMAMLIKKARKHLATPARRPANVSFDAGF
ncbi:roadblock/LC7 domain-containing protein [Streptomyces sp. PSKA54]|uniref:Roadblock/LC7 domain-containing protein n=1 Tax=Streptomyces himalayensis subsp. aureolus TaxID=2758039 RepID=A0A7W2HE15_9ACTN|nr:roadblock/LC7 domain-containing protein [Streptomyces himalayensis]MBA4860473.1 roadblock/LC7 domain-containing protein [Streptomyces himalayensis subsp. aureolus]